MSLSDGDPIGPGGVFPGFASFRDDAGAPFYRSRVRGFATPEQTTAEITGRLSRVVFDVVRDAARRPSAIEVDDLLRWHGGIFKTTFPYDAGKIRTGQTQFGIRWLEGGEECMRLVAGSDPGAIRGELRTAFAAYNAERERCAPAERSVAQAVGAAAGLYAEILRVHPFEDGNLRGAFAAL